MNKPLAQFIKDSLSNNKCKIGRKAVLRSVKNSKLIVCSKSLPIEVKSKIEQLAKAGNIPIHNLNHTSLELGKLCNKPFRISVISIDDIIGFDMSEILEEINEEESIKN